MSTFYTMVHAYTHDPCALCTKGPSSADMEEKSSWQGTVASCSASKQAALLYLRKAHMTPKSGTLTSFISVNQVQGEINQSSLSPVCIKEFEGGSTASDVFSMKFPLLARFSRRKPSLTLFFSTTTARPTTTNKAGRRDGKDGDHEDLGNVLEALEGLDCLGQLLQNTMTNHSEHLTISRGARRDFKSLTNRLHAQVLRTIVKACESEMHEA
ncbi:hypothetical protein B0T20DRAFT_92485 [Sordaria brevicollis]|uniref:Uncharacterized protein n=1 Tax=Sordaria brevicollis TaxID=83679 RepID=A0AAE0NWJ0_SORBR|nr:hypothetical protein B0T20DRAFT_92485 [Sordaria brevicollis]